MNTVADMLAARQRWAKPCGDQHQHGPHDWFSSWFSAFYRCEGIRGHD